MIGYSVLNFKNMFLKLSEKDEQMQSNKNNSFLVSILLMLSLTFTANINAQNLLHNRLQKLEQNQPDKVEAVAKRYSKIFKKNPVPYYFLSKDQLRKFSVESDQLKQQKNMAKAIKYARKSQKYGEKDGFSNQEEWLDYRDTIKFTGYFYFKETTLIDNNLDLESKFYRFISFEESGYLLDRDFIFEMPEKNKIEEQFYGLPTGNEFSDHKTDEEELKMLDLINEERKRLGLSTVEINFELSAACKYHAYDMGTQNYSGHQGYDLGKDGRVYFANLMFERIGQFYNQSKLLTENISGGREKAKFAYKGWVESKGHYRNLINPKNRVVGIGRVYIPNSKYGYYWVFNSAE